jgi:hypothetical protein
MKFELKINTDDVNELERVLRVLNPDAPKMAAVTPVMEGQPNSEANLVEPVVQTPKRGRPAKATSATAETTTPEPAAKEPAKLKVVPKESITVSAQVDGDIEKKDISLGDVRKALTEFLAANDEAAAAKLLAKHGKTDRLSKLDPEFFEAVYYAAVTPAVKDEFFNDDIPDMGVSK